MLRGVGPWAGGAEGSGCGSAGIQGVMRGAVFPVTEDSGVGEVGRTRGAIVNQFSVFYSKRVGGFLGVDASGVMTSVSHQSRKTVAGPRASRHGRDGRSGFCVVVDHPDCCLMRERGCL